MPRMGPKAYAEMGEAVLAAAETADTQLIERRLAAFTRAHRAYVAAQRQVQAVEAQERAARLRMAARITAHRRAIDHLARALIGDGASRISPFEALHPSPPSAIKRRSAAEQVQAIRQLLGTVKRRARLSARTRQTVLNTESAARAVEAAGKSLRSVQIALHDKRRTRDQIGATWKVALAALKHGARAADDDGAPLLHATLFPPVRPRRKRKRTLRSHGSSAMPTSR